MISKQLKHVFSRIASRLGYTTQEQPWRDAPENYVMCPHCRTISEHTEWGSEFILTGQGYHNCPDCGTSIGPETYSASRIPEIVPETNQDYTLQ